MEDFDWWDINYILEDLKDDLDPIFKKCKIDIVNSYSPVKMIFNDIRKKKYDDKRLQVLLPTMKDFKTRTVEYRLIVVEILNLVYKGYTEGFPVELESNFNEDRTNAIYKACKVLMDVHTEDALNILRGQHCQMYR